MGLQIQILIAAAIAPIAILMVWTFMRDRFREPPLVVSVTMLLGALAIVPIVVVQLVLCALAGVSMPPKDLFGVLFVSFVVAAVVEEIAKWTVLEAYSARHSAFDEPYDGIVYGVAASLGFALVENLMYVLGTGLFSFSAGAVNAIARALLSVPLHAACGVILGTCIGVARFAPRMQSKVLWRGLGIFGAIGLHGVYDVFAFMPGIEGADTPLQWMAYAGVLVTTALGFTVAALAAARLRRDQVRQAVLREQIEVVRPAPAAPGVPLLPMAALVSSGAGLLLIVVGFGLAMLSELSGQRSEPLMMVVGIAIIVGAIVDAGGCVLSGLALVVERRWRPASIVALVMSLLALLAVGSLIALGMIASALQG